MTSTRLMRLVGAVALATVGACGSVGSGDPDAGDVLADGAPDPADADTQPQFDAAGDVDAALSWSALEPVDVDYGENVETPIVSADGLTLYFTTLAGGFDIYYATRGSTDADFGAAAPLPITNVPDQAQRYVELSHDGLELYFTSGDVAPIMVSTRPDLSSDWGEPVSVGVSGNFPSISGDKLSLYYIEHVENGEGLFRRITRAAPGQPWSSPTTVELPGGIDIYSSIEISRDELSVLRAPLLTGDGANDILIGHRASKTDTFGNFSVLLTVENVGGSFSSARWNADETEIWVNASDNGAVKPHVSHLR